MTRRALWVWLAGAVGLKAQSANEAYTEQSPQMRGWNHENRAEVAPRWQHSHPRNGQCPVCGWQAEAYRTGQIYYPGAQCWPPVERRIDCQVCSNTFRQRAEERHGK